MEDPKDLFEQRLGRYQAAIALEKTDRMPVATGSNYLAESYSGNTKQQTIYDPEKWLQAEAAFIRSFPMDMYRRPEKLIQACDVLVDEMVQFVLTTADPLKRYPIFVPTHKPMFLSPEQFETFYWPSFKRTMERLIGAIFMPRMPSQASGSANPLIHLSLRQGLPKVG